MVIYAVLLLLKNLFMLLAAIECTVFLCQCLTSYQAPHVKYGLLGVQCRCIGRIRLGSKRSPNGFDIDLYVHSNQIYLTGSRLKWRVLISASLQELVVIMPWLRYNRVSNRTACEMEWL